MTKLLVITPTLGRSPWLGETVASVAAFGTNHKHILVTPAATVTSLAGRFSRVAVLAESGGGMYGAINTALRTESDWDAFTYLNDDDLLLPDFPAVTRALAPASRPLAVYGGVRLIDARGRRVGAIPVSPKPAFNRLLYAQRIEPVYQHGSVFTRAAYEQLGGFDASFQFCGDSEFLARACVVGVPFLRATRREVAAFRLRAGQMTKARPVMIAERLRVDAKLGLCAGRITLRHRWARWYFRFANLPAYAERIARHGFVSFDQLLARVGGSDSDVPL